MSTLTLTERTAVTGRVDRRAAVIRGVKVCGRTSLNGRTYTPEALRKAATLYEGAAVYADHPESPTSARSVRDRIGTLRDVRYSGDGLYANLHYNAAHPLAEQLIWAAEHDPSLMGLSHNVVAKTTTREGKVVVEEITRVLSVDLVAEPATVAGLFEGLAAVGASAAMRERITRRLAAPMTAKQFAEAITGQHPTWPNEAPDEINEKFASAILRVARGDGTKSEKLKLIDKLLTAWEAAAETAVDVDQIIADILGDQTVEHHRSVIEAITGRAAPSSAAAFARAIKE